MLSLQHIHGPCPKAGSCVNDILLISSTVSYLITVFNGSGKTTLARSSPVSSGANEGTISGWRHIGHGRHPAR